MNSRLFRIVGVLFFFFLLSSHFFQLADKPYHHDESIHSVEAWRYATQGKYEFNPMLHGPFLYHYVAAAYELFPITDTTGRAAVALMGVLAVLLGLFLFSQTSSKLLWLGLASLSPILCYYSRTLIHDLPIIFFTIGLLVSVVYYCRTSKPLFLYFAAAAFAFMVSIKLNSVMYAFSFLTFLPFIRKKLPLDRLRSHWPHLICAFALAAFIYSSLYSSLFRHNKGILDGLYREMIPYWAHQNRIQRIRGAFTFYLPILATYELPLFFLLIGSGVSAIRTQFAWKYVSVVSALLGLLLFFFSWKWSAISPHFGFLHMSDPYDPVLALLVLVVWIFLLRFHLQRKETLAALAFHWGCTSFLLYSYAGEKVPWLSTHILIPWIIYCAVVVPTWWPSGKKWLTVALSVTAISWQAFVTLRSSFFLEASTRERLVYTHTSWDMVELNELIAKAAEFTDERKDFKIQVIGDAGWPLYWYLRDLKSWFRYSIQPEENSWIIVCNWGEEPSLLEKFPARTYKVERFKLREWWVPDASKASISNFIRYFFFRKTFSPSGSSDLAVLIRTDLYANWTRWRSLIDSGR